MLDYIALFLLIAILALVVYGLIALWSIPYEIAKGRNHPHTEAIGVATWVSLFTLGILGRSCGSGQRFISPARAGAFQTTRARRPPIHPSPSPNVAS